MPNVVVCKHNLSDQTQSKVWKVTDGILYNYGKIIYIYLLLWNTLFKCDILRLVFGIYLIILHIVQQCTIVHAYSQLILPQLICK